MNRGETVYQMLARQAEQAPDVPAILAPDRPPLNYRALCHHVRQVVTWMNVPTLGEDLAAAVVLHDGSSATEPELRRFAFARLADYKVPSHGHRRVPSALVRPERKPPPEAGHPGAGTGVRHRRRAPKTRGGWPAPRPAACPAPARGQAHQDRVSRGETDLVRSSLALTMLRGSLETTAERAGQLKRAPESAPLLAERLQVGPSEVLGRHPLAAGRRSDPSHRPRRCRHAGRGARRSRRPPAWWPRGFAASSCRPIHREQPH
jgi:hypothetical protein